MDGIKNIENRRRPLGRLCGDWCFVFAPRTLATAKNRQLAIDTAHAAHPEYTVSTSPERRGVVVGAVSFSHSTAASDNPWYLAGGYQAWHVQSALRFSHTINLENRSYGSSILSIDSLFISAAERLSLQHALSCAQSSQ